MSSERAPCLCLAVALIACDASHVTDRDAGPEIVCAEAAVAPRPARPLRPEQHAAIVEGLTGALPEERLAVFGPSERLGAAVSGVPDVGFVFVLTEEADRAAPRLADQAGCAADLDCYRGRLRGLLTEALRRPPSAATLAFYGESLDATAASTADARAAFVAVVTSILLSPQFAFVVELGEPSDPSAARWPLRPEERLTRLSLALRLRGPTVEELEGPLDPASIDAQVTTWLETAEPGVARFHQRWLRTHEAVAADPLLEASFEGETAAFVEDVYRGDATFDALLISRHSFLDARSGAAYGVAATGDRPARVELDPGLSSLLTHGSWLAERDYSERGVVVYEELLCQGEFPMIPPAELPPVEPMPGESARAAWERAVAEPACASCHDITDPYGYALGALGRDASRDAAADTSAEILEGPLEGVIVDGAPELARTLAGSGVARACHVERWTLYLLDRPLTEDPEDPTRSERCQLARATEGFVRDGDLRGMVAAVARLPILGDRPARPTADEPAVPDAGEDLSEPARRLEVAADQTLSLAAVLPREEVGPLEMYALGLRELATRMRRRP